MRALLRCGLAISIVGGTAYAELLRVEQAFGGFECLSCVESIVKGVKRLRGVQSAEVDAKRGMVRIELAEGNRVKLDAIRDAIKATGFTPGEATITAKGSLQETRFVLDGYQQTFLTPGEAAKKWASGVATVIGVVPASAAGEPLRLNIRELRPGGPDSAK